jgi:hypothetical protein
MRVDTARLTEARISWNPTTLTKPCFAMCLPFSHSTNVPNNAWMEELRESERTVDHRRALVQFLDLYHYVSSEAVVCLVPSTARSGCRRERGAVVALMA